jgi:hypothetical protein
MGQPLQILILKTAFSMVLIVCYIKVETHKGSKLQELKLKPDFREIDYLLKLSGHQVEIRSNYNICVIH